MVEFYINGQKVEVQLENEQTIGDVLKSFEKTCEENDAAVIGITVDNKQITAEIFDEDTTVFFKHLQKNFPKSKKITGLALPTWISP